MMDDAGPDLHRQVFLLESALNHVGTAVCVCDRLWRLEFANERFAEVWGLDAPSLVPGASLAALLRSAVRPGENSPDPVKDYLGWCGNLDAPAGETVRIVEPANGRRYRACHHPLANGAWLVTLDDLTAEAINAELASEKLSLQLLIDTVPDYLWVKDVESRFVVANKALARDWGRIPEEMVGLSDIDFHSPDIAAGFARAEREIIETERPMLVRDEFVLNVQGEGKWFSSTKMPLKDADGSTVGLVGISRDITDLRREVTFREGQSAVLEMIATAAPLDDILNAIVALVEAQISDASVSIVLEASDRKHIGRGTSAFIRKRLDRDLDRLLRRGEAQPEGRLSISDGGSAPEETPGRPTAGLPARDVLWSKGIASQKTILGLLALSPATMRTPTAHETAVTEIASRLAGIAVERQMTEEHIRHLANHDALTGLANRSMLDGLLARAIETADRRRAGVQVLFIDLDDFKSINDSLGHHVGDELLKEVAVRLKRSVGIGDSVIRLGGDEFVAILVGQPESSVEDTRVVERIVAALCPPFQYGGHRLRVSCSVGVASFPDDGTTPDSLLARADLAMYRSKQDGKGRFTVYAEAVR